MKKLFFIFAFLPFFVFGGNARIKTFTSGTNTTYVIRGFDVVDDLYTLYYNTPFGIVLNRNKLGITSPVSSSSASSAWSKLLNNQIALNGVSYTNSPADFAYVNKIFVTAFTLLSSGYSGSGVLHYEQVSVNHCYNIDFRLMVQDVLSSTNTAYHSILLSSLASINSSINNIRVDLGQFQTDFQTVNSGVLNVSNYIDAAAAQNIISDYQADLYKNNIASAYSDPVTWGDPSSFARFVYDNIDAINNTLNQANALNSNPDRLNDFARSFGNSFSAAGARHFTTPLTNEMQRINANWVNETKAALSNNTQKIKDDLQAWKDMLSGPNGSQAAIVSALNGAMNNTGAFKVELQNANNSVYVHLDGPITLNSAQFQDVNNKLQANFDIFHDWIYAIPESWVRYFYMFRENSTAVLTNQSEQISLLSSLTNLLFEYSLNFTSNTMFAISNSFAGLSFTNQYLLLSDYQTFVDSSKYIDIISSLPPDLSSALSSYGFSDSSDYSGRWWAFITANSAYQSTLLSTNAALASTLLSALEQIDDDEEGSLLSRWLSLIRSLPDPEELQIMISDASNIVSNVGFDRVDSFYNTVTSDFANVSKNVFRDKALPSVLSFTYLPAIDGRDAKIVEIPVGEHSSLWSLFRRGMAFAISVVTLILFPKYLSWLLTHYISLVQRVIRSLHAYTHT